MGKYNVMTQKRDCVLQQHSLTKWRREGTPPPPTVPLESYTIMLDGRATVQQDTLVSMVTGVRRSEDELLKP